jgi:hypothetical protein
MAPIRNLTIRNQVDGRSVPVESIEGDVRISELIEAYKAELGIPANQEVNLKRKATNRQLISVETIAGAGIQSDETLLAEMAYTAGNNDDTCK